MNTEPIYAEFGQRVRMMRQMATSMTQADLAKKVGLTRTSVVNIEAGRQRILLHDVETFAKAFRVSPAKLLKGLWGERT